MGVADPKDVSGNVSISMFPKNNTKTVMQSNTCNKKKLKLQRASRRRVS